MHELHDQKEIFLVLVDVEEFDNIGMVHLLENIDLILQTYLVLLGQLAPKNKFPHTRCQHKDHTYFAITLMATRSLVALERPFLTLAKLPLYLQKYDEVSKIV